MSKSTLSGCRVLQNCVAVLIFVVSSGGVCPAAPVYTLQVGAYPSAEEAGLERDRFAVSCGPVVVHNEDGATTCPYKVMVGRYPTRVDAWIAQKTLRAGLAPGCFVKNTEWQDSEPVENRLPLSMPFDTSGLDESARLSTEEYWPILSLVNPFGSTTEAISTTPYDAMTADELLAAGSARSNHAQAMDAVRRFLARHGRDPRANKARLCLARLNTDRGEISEAESNLERVEADGTEAEKKMAEWIRCRIELKQKRYAEAKERFRAYANDKQTPLEYRLRAMGSFGYTAQTMRRLDEAWLAQIQREESAPNGRVKAEARMIRGSIAFELVTAKKSTWKETRAILDSVAEMEGASSKTLATASLMLAESHYLEQHYELALSGLDGLLARFPSVKREYYAGSLLRGKTLCRMGRLEEAKQALESILALPIRPAEKFGNREPKAHAALWLAYICGLQGDTEGQTRYRTMIRMEYPGTSDDLNAASMFGAVE